MAKPRHKIVDGNCYLYQPKETYIGPCKDPSHPHGKKGFTKMNGQNLPTLPGDIE